MGGAGSVPPGEENEVPGAPSPSAEEETKAQVGKRTRVQAESQKRGAWDRQNSAQIPALPLNCCVTSYKPFNLPEPTQVVERIKSAISMSRARHAGGGRMLTEVPALLHQDRSSPGQGSPSSFPESPFHS